MTFIFHLPSHHKEKKHNINFNSPSLAHLENSGVILLDGTPPLQKIKQELVEFQRQAYRVCHFKVCDEITKKQAYFKTAPRSASRSLASPWSSPEQGIMSASVYLKP